MAKFEVTNHWFKAKRYGWGWTPASWQGWAIIVWMAALIIYRATKLNSSTNSIFNFFIYLTIILGATVWLCYLTGEKPTWRWARKKDA